MINVELTWNNLTLMTKTNKKLINDISGQVVPGKITAIIGPSGSGKTTLLNSLAGRNPKSLKLEGQILANGRNRDPDHWPQTMAYVNQELFAFTRQTVLETLGFAAYAKLSDNSDIPLKISETLKMLDLESIKDSFLYTLSGGEKMKVGIGIEFLGNPSIIFLDEPTSGLDSSNALNIFKILQNLAKLGKTIVLTVHQPSNKMLNKIDSLILMSKGSILFQGSINDCIEFFNKAGYAIPENTNPSAFFIDTIESCEKNSESHENLIKIWKSASSSNEPKIFDPIYYETKTRPGMFILLLNREWKELVRNKSAVKAKIFQRAFGGFLCAFAFFNASEASGNIFSFRGLVIFFVTNEYFSIYGPILNQFSKDRKIMQRERMSGFYNGLEAYYAIFLAMTSYLLMFEIPYNLILYYVVGLNRNFGTFIIFLIVICEMVLFSISFGFTIGILTPNSETSQIIGATISLIYILYSGAYSVAQDIPAVARWLIFFSPLYYAFSAAFHNQLSGTNINGVSGESILVSLGLNTISLLPATMILLGIILGYQILGSIILEIKTKNNLLIN